MFLHRFFTGTIAWLQRSGRLQLDIKFLGRVSYGGTVGVKEFPDEGMKMLFAVLDLCYTVSRGTYTFKPQL